MLTQPLRRLQRHGLIKRQAFAVVPLRVEYELTKLGRSLMDPIDALTEWAEHHGAAVLSMRWTGRAPSTPARRRLDRCGPHRAVAGGRRHADGHRSSGDRALRAFHARAVPRRSR